MALLNNTQLKAFTDRLAAIYSQTINVLGTSAGVPVNGTVRGTLQNLLTDTAALADYEELTDLLQPVNTALGAGTEQQMLGWVRALLLGLTAELNLRGSEVAASIVDLPTYLTYYNGGSGGAKFSCLLTPEFAALWKYFFTALPVAGVMSPALQAEWNSTLTVGMANKNTAGTQNLGAAVDTTQYSEVLPVIEVRTAFSGGGAAPTVTISGTDDLGAAATWGPITLTGNNPAAALAGVTITPAIVAQTKVSVAVNTSTGIVVGSVLTIQKNKPDQEVVIVEAVADATHFTATFTKAHSGGATVDGWNSYGAGNASTGAGRRLRAVTGITLGLSAHGAGLVSIAGSQDRYGV